MDQGAVFAVISRLVDAVNGGDQEAALALLTSDVTIVEDLAPYRWQGPDAGASWMRAMWENGQRSGMTDIRMRIASAARIEAEGDDAYAVVPGLLTYSGAGPPLRADGILTFTLKRTGETWLISALAWSGPRAT
jgi:ketosteroid isomerase-like protein